jgi:hypothetical protein
MGPRHETVFRSGISKGLTPRRQRIFRHHPLRRRKLGGLRRLLSAFAAISYASNWIHARFAAAGSWIGGFLSITALNWIRPRKGGPEERA